MSASSPKTGNTVDPSHINSAGVAVNKVDLMIMFLFVFYAHT